MVELKFAEWSTDPVIREQQIDLAINRKKMSLAERLAMYDRPKRKYKQAEVVPTEKRFWEREQWKDEFEQTLPYRPRCTDDFELGVYQVRREIAINHRYVQLNLPWRIQWLTADLDYAGAKDAWKTAGVPTPNFVCETPHNGHAHVDWMIRTPVSSFDSAKSNLLSCVERALQVRLKADQAFNLGGLSKNPTHSDWNVQRLHTGAYGLNELTHGFRSREIKPWTKKEKRTGYGRNCALFDELRKIAGRKVLKFKAANWESGDFIGSLMETAFSLNSTFGVPLPASEIHTIVKSVGYWVWNHFSEEGLEEWHRRGGVARAKQMWEGHVTAEEKARALGISRMTYYRRLKAGLLPNTALYPDIAIVSQIDE